MSIFKSVADTVIQTIGKIHWPAGQIIDVASQEDIKRKLKTDYFIILTYRRNHLSSFFVCLANFVLTGRWGRWTHALMNLEDHVDGDEDFRLIEATGTGTHFSPFDKVFDVHGAVLLKPKSMTLDEWTGLLDRAKTQLGKPYDSLFNLASDQELSCVELVRTVLMGQPNYATDFANFEALIKKRKNLTPQMFYDCGDFEVVYEVRV